MHRARRGVTISDLIQGSHPSSVVEQCIRNAQVQGSNPWGGSSNYIRAGELHAGPFCMHGMDAAWRPIWRPRTASMGGRGRTTADSSRRGSSCARHSTHVNTHTGLRSRCLLACRDPDRRVVQGCRRSRDCQRGDIRDAARAHLVLCVSELQAEADGAVICVMAQTRRICGANRS